MVRNNSTISIASLSLGSWKHHDLTHRLQEASKQGFQGVELFDEDWCQYLKSHQTYHAYDPWDPTTDNLRVARQLADEVHKLGMRIICVQPLRQVVGKTDPIARRESLANAARIFPFLRAFRTDLTFVCASIHTGADITSSYAAVTADLRKLGEMAKAFSAVDGGDTIRIGYEGLSWSDRNTWSSTWEIVRAVNLPNVGLVVDTFHWLAVEYADPYAASKAGLAYSTIDESQDVLNCSITNFLATVPLDKIFLLQLSDAEFVDPLHLESICSPDSPKLQVWSRYHRLFPMEHDRGAYLSVVSIASAIINSGYTGPVSLEVFNSSLHVKHEGVPTEHARRGMDSLRRLFATIGSPRQEMENEEWE
ncbi:xylose isomerase-like protein [Aspergillus granulosus]|uniref:Xylose isomerase-like protein n=1 Tax=Aspergillus granulosus TaxID=176169 RepID=A0ABR4H082_9EURO